MGFTAVEHRIARRGDSPMLDLTLLRNPSFTGLMTGAFLLQAGAFGCLALVSLWLQSLVGLSPVGAGLALTPLAAASFVVSVVAGRRVQRLSPRRPIGLGLLLVAAGMLLLSAGRPGHSRTGLCRHLHRAPAACRDGRRRRQHGTPVGHDLAIAVLGAAFASRATATLTQGGLPHADAAADALASGRADAVIASAPAGQRAAVTGLAHRAFTAGLDRVFLFAALAAAVGAVAVLLLVRPAASASGPGRASGAAAQTPAPARR